VGLTNSSDYKSRINLVYNRKTWDGDHTCIVTLIVHRKWLNNCDYLVLPKATTTNVMHGVNIRFKCVHFTFKSVQLYICTSQVRSCFVAAKDISPQFMVWTILVEAIPMYVEELLLQLTCWVECTSWDDSGSWSRAVILYKRWTLFIYNKHCACLWV